jgi:hypothetical protein
MDNPRLYISTVMTAQVGAKKRWKDHTRQGHALDDLDDVCDREDMTRHGWLGEDFILQKRNLSHPKKRVMICR